MVVEQAEASAPLLTPVAGVVQSIARAIGHLQSSRASSPSSGMWSTVRGGAWVQSSGAVSSGGSGGECSVPGARKHIEIPLDEAMD